MQSAGCGLAAFSEYTGCAAGLQSGALPAQQCESGFGGKMEITVFQAWIYVRLSPKEHYGDS